MCICNFWSQFWIVYLYSSTVAKVNCKLVMMFFKEQFFWGDRENSFVYVTSKEKFFRICFWGFIYCRNANLQCNFCTRRHTFSFSSQIIFKKGPPLFVIVLEKQFKFAVLKSKYNLDDDAHNEIKCIIRYRHKPMNFQVDKKMKKSIVLDTCLQSKSPWHSADSYPKYRFF